MEEGGYGPVFGASAEQGEGDLRRQRYSVIVLILHQEEDSELRRKRWLERSLCREA